MDVDLQRQLISAATTECFFDDAGGPDENATPAEWGAPYWLQHNGEVVAFATTMVTSLDVGVTPALHSIWYVCVPERFRGRGLASVLVQRVAAKMCEEGESTDGAVWLTVDHASVAAVRSYEKIGFQRVHTFSIEQPDHSGSYSQYKLLCD